MRRYNITYRSSGTVIDDAFMWLLIGWAITLPLAWATHFIWVIRKLAGDAGVTIGQVGLGFLGAFFPPVGMLHGYMIWFGVGF